MDYRLETIACSLRFAVKRETLKTADAFKAVPQLWAKAHSNGFLQQLIDMSWENLKLASQPCIENYLAPGAAVERELWVPVLAR